MEARSQPAAAGNVSQNPVSETVSETYLLSRGCAVNWLCSGAQDRVRTTAVLSTSDTIIAAADRVHPEVLSVYRGGDCGRQFGGLYLGGSEAGHHCRRA